jgi:hypothetical protein
MLLQVLYSTPSELQLMECCFVRSSARRLTNAGGVPTVFNKNRPHLIQRDAVIEFFNAVQAIAHIPEEEEKMPVG